MGTAVALPFLEAMVPAMAAIRGAKPPVRMAFVYVPNGIIMNGWNPDYEGKLGELPRILKPLEPFKDDLLLLGNLTHNAGRALLDGAGDHGRCSASYLTGVHPRKTLVDIKAGVSFDQLVAKQVGAHTRFPSLELGMEDARQAGDCDSGYSCAYTNNLAWESETQPLPPVLDPRALFERLFGKGQTLTPEARTRENLYRRSILDFVSDDTRKLEADLGPTDRRKLDEYLSSIREIERQIERAEHDNAQIDPHMEKPYGVPADFAEHFKLMTDMMTVAFQSDLTRVMTFLVTHEGTSRPYWIGKMKSIKEGDSTLLDNCMIVYGAGLSDGNRHLHEDLPTLIAGRGGDYIKSGRRIVYRRETPMCNLFLAMMDRMGVHVEHFGDSTGRLDGLDLA
jgi:hypothetical protein